MQCVPCLIVKTVSLVFISYTFKMASISESSMSKYLVNIEFKHETKHIW